MHFLPWEVSTLANKRNNLKNLSCCSGFLQRENNSSFICHILLLPGLEILAPFSPFQMLPLVFNKGKQVCSDELTHETSYTVPSLKGRKWSLFLTPVESKRAGTSKRCWMGQATSTGCKSPVALGTAPAAAESGAAPRFRCLERSALSGAKSKVSTKPALFK